MSKKNKVLEYLQENKTITSWEAIQLFRATRLSSIIFELKEKYIITSELKVSDGERWSVYTYGGEKNEV